MEFQSFLLHVSYLNPNVIFIYLQNMHWTMNQRCCNWIQCRNGHVVRSSCCTKLGKRCPSCSRSIAYSCCLAIEKVLESIEISCPYLQYGCKEPVRYSQKRNHEVTCNYAPRECPFSDCTFHGSFEQFSLHFKSKHLVSITCFRHNRSFTITLGKNKQVLVFQGEEDGLLFLLKNLPELVGNAISVTCFGPSSPREGSGMISGQEERAALLECGLS